MQPRATILFEIVCAVTTRSQRADDFNYEYINDVAFSRLTNRNKLLTSTTYHGKKYGIKLDKYNEVLSRGKFPILILTPDSAMALLDSFDGRFMCFFIDSSD